MRILQVIQRYAPYVGGSELYFQTICERLAAEGHKVTVLTTDAWDLEHFWASGRRRIDRGDEIINGVQVRRFAVRRLHGPPILYPILRRAMVELGRIPGTAPLLRRMALLTPRVPALERYLRTTDEIFDLVSTTNITLDFTILPAADFARRHGIPHVITPFIHTGEPGSRQIIRYYTMRHHLQLMRHSARVIVQTSIEEEALLQRGIPTDRLRRVGAGVDMTALEGGDGARFRREQELGATPVVLFIGTAAYDKGAVHLLEAARQLWRSGHDLALVFLGSSTMAHFDQLYAGLASEEQRRCRLILGASHQQKLDALAAANVFAMPSRTDTFGIVYLEAWCYELPVIGAYAGGVPDVIDDGENGYLIPFGDTAALAARIALLIDNPQLARRMGAAGREKVRRELTWEHKFNRFKAILEELVPSAARKPDPGPQRPLPTQPLR